MSDNTVTKAEYLRDPGVHYGLLDRLDRIRDPEGGRIVMTIGRPQMEPEPVPDGDNDDIDNQRPRWTVRRSMVQTLYYCNGTEVGRALRRRDDDGLWWAHAFNEQSEAVSLTYDADRAEAEAWVCSQTGHPGTHDPPRRVGDCHGAEVQHCGHLTSAIVSSGEGLQATNYCGACAVEGE